jgi:hypothetical protein
MNRYSTAAREREKWNREKGAGREANGLGCEAGSRRLCRCRVGRKIRCRCRRWDGRGFEVFSGGLHGSIGPDRQHRDAVAAAGAGHGTAVGQDCLSPGKSELVLGPENLISETVRHVSQLRSVEDDAVSGVEIEVGVVLRNDGILHYSIAQLLGGIDAARDHGIGENSSLGTRSGCSCGRFERPDRRSGREEGECWLGRGTVRTEASQDQTCRKAGYDGEKPPGSPAE